MASMSGLPHGEDVERMTGSRSSGSPVDKSKKECLFLQGVLISGGCQGVRR